MSDEHPDTPFRFPEVYLTKYLGFQTESPEPGRTTVTLEVQPEHLNITGAVHGGFFMTVLDTLMGHAVFTHLGDPRARFGTSQMTTHFLRAVSGGQLRGEGQVVAQGADFLAAEAELRDGQGQLIATAEAQFTHIRPGASNSKA
jgi:uncharacterized protein (TIGR00369 family)